MGKWIVFWTNGRRIGSVRLGEETLADAKALMSLTLIQTDITGTQHYEVLRTLKPKVKS